MIENDFPSLRSSARDSVIGRAVSRLLSRVGNAAPDAVTTRVVTSQIAIVRGTGSQTIQSIAVMLMMASFGTWMLSQFVPLYVSMAIPRSAFLVVAIVCGLAAWRSNGVAEQLSRSRVRRVSDWLRGA